jgi:hypothetical protein
MADVCKIDLADAVYFKLRINGSKYPVKFSRGNDEKRK